MAHKEHLLRLKTFTIIFLKEKILNLKCPKFGVGFKAQDPELVPRLKTRDSRTRADSC